MQKLISFTIYAEKGFLKKPDINEGIYLTYNMLHKPAILGILGAIAGLEGYKKNQVLPEYYKTFANIPIGVKPERHDKGNFQKTVITYNNTTGLASGEGNLIITEQTLIDPAYTIFLLLDLSKEKEKTLYENILHQKAEYLPYLGKNDYSIWWYKEEVKEYEYEKINAAQNKSFQIETIINKEKFLLKNSIDDDMKSDFDFLDLSSLDKKEEFIYFERLPIGFDTNLYQYKMIDFAFTNFSIKPNHNLNSIIRLKASNQFIQLN